jgi:hypothetical protein
MRTALTVMSMVFVLAGCGSAADTATTPGPVTAGNGEQPTGASGGDTVSTSSGSCVEQYSLRALRNREFAFDGTVTDIRTGEPDADAGAAPVRVTYQVHQWFAGGGGDTVTVASWGFIVDGSSDSSVPVTSVGDPALTEGTRLLVSGDTDMQWACGFTRPYSAAEAARWEAAFAE